MKIKINGLYALFVALERVNMHYIEKMKSRNNNPQTAKQKLKARLQICKNMKQVLKNTKKYEDVLTDEQKNLLPNSCNIDPLKPHSENLTELTNPYFKKPPTKQAKIPDLLTKDKFTSEIKKEKLPKISTSTDTTASPEVLLPQIQDTIQPVNECSSTTSTKSKKLHPWCKSTRTKEEIKDKSPPAKQQTITEAIKPSKQLKISSTEYSENNEENQLDTSSTPISAKLKGLHPWCTIARRQDDIKDESTKKTSPAEEPSPETQLTSNIEIRTKEKTEENETVTDQKELDEVKKNESFVHPQRSNIKYMKRSADDQL